MYVRFKTLIMVRDMVIIKMFLNQTIFCSSNANVALLFFLNSTTAAPIEGVLCSSCRYGGISFVRGEFLC
jgi:hypothetical protein